MRLETKVSEMKAILPPARMPSVSDDEMATAETEFYLIRATIASRFGVPIDSIDLVTTDDTGILRIRYATVFLTEKDVNRIMSNREA